MSKWIAEFELEDGDTMPEHMDLEYKGVRMDFHCKPQEPTTKNDLGVDAVSRKAVKEQMIKYGFHAPDMTVTEFVEDLPSVTPQEPFINKPCVSEKQCEHDKNVVIDKIRAEIENDWQLKKYRSSPFSCGLRRAIEIIDKYKAESENP